MAAGLRIWDAAANLIIDTTTAVPLIIGEGTIGGAGAAKSGSFHDARLALGDPFITVVSGGLALSGGAPNNLPQFSFVNNALHWSYPDPNGSGGHRVQCRFLFGIR